MSIDINSDMGELNHLLADGTYEKLMDHVTSINVACGGHAGDDEMMAAMVLMAKDKGVSIGAHPSFPDKENFGRKEMEDIDPNDLNDSIRDQIEKLVDSSLLRYNELVSNKSIDIPEGFYPGEYLKEVGKNLVEKYGYKY